MRLAAGVALAIGVASTAQAHRAVAQRGEGEIMGDEHQGAPIKATIKAGPGFEAPWITVEADPALLVDDEVTIAIQVNGKLRDTLTVAKGLSNPEVEALALASEKVQRALDGAEVRKVIVVPDRLVNIVA